MRSAERTPARATIAAIASAPGHGGVGIVRVSGADVERIARAVFGNLPPARRAAYGVFRDRDGEVIDRGLALYFSAPASYTGEPVLELQGHGGPAVLQAVLAACIEAGAQLAAPGEFTKRAFLEGKLDLAQAEAVADLIAADTRAAARGAMRSLSGEFSEAIHALVAQLVELRALIEAMLDFPEEEVDSLHQSDASERLIRVRRSLASVMERSQRGSLLRTGINIVLAGAPNVGKSSLLNRLAGEERAIVTPAPGTTRDALREPIQIDGVPLIVIDTAGLRDSADEVERIGIARTRSELARADVVLEVLDASEPRAAAASALAPAEIQEGVRRIRVFNKCDLLAERPEAQGGSQVWVSAKTGEGMNDLRAAILSAAGWTASRETVFMARERHLRALASAGAHLESAAVHTRQWEFLAEELRLAQRSLGEITGEVSAEDLLGEIFSRFCIGK